MTIKKLTANALVWIAGLLLAFGCASTYGPSTPTDVPPPGPSGGEAVDEGTDAGQEPVEVAPRRAPEEGTRAAADIPPAVGTWEMTYETPRGTRETTVQILGSAGDLSGTITTRLGETPLDRVSLEGDTLSFSYTLSFQGREIRLSVLGEIDGDAFEGALTTPRGETPISGTRQTD